MIIEPVKAAETVSTRSHGMRFLNISRTESFIYGLSDGVTAPILSISSVASSRMTFITSSTVTMPTSLSSLSTTGSTMLPYFVNTFATSSLSSSVLTDMMFSFITEPTEAPGSASISVRIVTIPISRLPRSVT